MNDEDRQSMIESRVDREVQEMQKSAESSDAPSIQQFVAVEDVPIEGHSRFEVRVSASDVAVNHKVIGTFAYADTRMMGKRKEEAKTEAENLALTVKLMAMAYARQVGRFIVADIKAKSSG